MKTKGTKNYNNKYILKVKNMADGTWIEKGHYITLQKIAEELNIPYESAKKVYEKNTKFYCQMYLIEHLEKEPRIKEKQTHVCPCCSHKISEKTAKNLLPYNPEN